MTQQKTCCGCEAKKKTVLLYACSGGSNVAEASDQACRQLMGEGLGAMYCLAGLGAGIESMVQQARDADINIVIDGCPMDCGRKIFTNLRPSNVQFIRVTDLGLTKKPKGNRATDEEVTTIVNNVKQLMAAV